MIQSNRRNSISLLLLCILAGCATVPLEQLEPPNTSSQTRVATWNVRFDNADDPESERQEHIESVIQIISSIQPDIACVQEAVTISGYSIVHSNPFISAMKDSLVEYGWIAPIGGAQLTDSNPILYRKDRYLPIKQGIFWFSSTPEVPDSHDWGNAIPRYCVWAKFCDITSGGYLFVANIHLDPVFLGANRLAADALLAFLDAEQFDLPIIICGDFNSPRGSYVQTVLSDRFSQVLEAKDGPTTATIPRVQIDQIFCSPDIEILEGIVVKIP